MASITYTRLDTVYPQPCQVRNTHGIVTTFGDLLAYQCFVDGLFALRGRGVDIELIDSDGQLLVGDFGDKTVAVA